MINKKMGRVNLSASAKGKKPMAGSISSNFAIYVHSLGFNDYLYQDITMDGSTSGDSVRLSLLSRDPNSTINLGTEFSYKDSILKGELTGKFHVNPGMLALYKDTFDFSANWKGNFSISKKALQADLWLHELDFAN